MATFEDIAAGLQNYVVSPLNAFGIGGFAFDAESDSAAHLSADVTDHYTEDNTAVQDHIAIRPKRITLRGYVGEVVYTQAGGNAAFLQKAVQKLTVISAYLPQLAAGAQQVKQTLEAPRESTLTLGDAANIYGLVKNLINTTGDQARQQAAFTYFEALMEKKVLMAIQTPWKFLTNMVIEAVVARQDETSRYISDFSVTFKQFRTAKTKSLAYVGASQLQGPCKEQGELLTQIGPVPGLKLPTTQLPNNQELLSGVPGMLRIPGVESIYSYRAQVGL